MELVARWNRAREQAWYLLECVDGASTSGGAADFNDEELADGIEAAPSPDRHGYL